MAKKKGNGNSQGFAYTDEEVNSLLLLMNKILPISPREWDTVCREHNENWPNSNRDSNSIRGKFNSLANQRVPTGDPNCPPLVKFAKVSPKSNYKEV
jgi:hypothetical protein